MGAIGKGVAWGAAGLLLLAGCTAGTQSTPSATPTDVPTPTVSQLPTTPVPPPVPGSAEETVDAGTPSPAKSVDVKKTASVSSGLEVNLASIKGIQAQATNPGEISGPAIAVTITVHNRTGKPVELDNVVVTATDSANQASSEITGPPASPFTGSVTQGAKANGTYIFRMDAGVRSNVRIVVSVGPQFPDAVFTGRAG